MSREFPVNSISTDWSEPLWPYDLDDSYLQLDLGDSESVMLQDVRVFRKPWFKQNYRHTTPKNIKFYKRPFFQVETPE